MCEYTQLNMNVFLLFHLFVKLIAEYIDGWNETKTLFIVFRNYFFITIRTVFLAIKNLKMGQLIETNFDLKQKQN